MMSLKTQARTVIFQDFLDQNLTRKERKQISKHFSLEDLSNNLDQINQLKQMMRCLRENRFNGVSDHSSEIDQKMKKIDRCFPLKKFYFFLIDLEKKSINLKITFPTRLKNQTKTDHSFDPNSTSLNQVLHSKSKTSRQNQLIDYFKLDIPSSSFQEIKRSDQVVGFLFYETIDPIKNLHLEDFWNILLIP